MLDQTYVRNVLTNEARYMDGHGAETGYLGSGILYYALAYMLKAQVCVCLGSGGGFVPRMMKQAQRDLGIRGMRTILVDNLSGTWGPSIVGDEESFFRKQFPDVELWAMDTAVAAYKLWEAGIAIDYCHFDANHDYDAVLEDWLTYRELLTEYGAMTFHDTSNLGCGVPRLIGEISEDRQYDVVDFPEAGAGVAIVRRVCNGLEIS